MLRADMSTRWQRSHGRGAVLRPFPELARGLLGHAQEVLLDAVRRACSGAGGGANGRRMAMLGVEGVLAARAAILERAGGIGGPAAGAAAPGFGAILDRALASVQAAQADASAASAAFERGDTDDIATVMLKRQSASIDFEMALQVRNRLLGAYRDIMNMPV